MKVNLLGENFMTVYFHLWQFHIQHHRQHRAEQHPEHSPDWGRLHCGGPQICVSICLHCPGGQAMVLAHSASSCFVPSLSLHLYLYTVPALLPHTSNFVNPYLFVLNTLLHFPVAYLMLNCIFAFPFFPWWKPAVLWVMNPPPREEDWRWQREWLQDLHRSLIWGWHLSRGHLLKPWSEPWAWQVKKSWLGSNPVSVQDQQIYHLLLSLPHLLLMLTILADSYFNCLLDLELCSFLWAWRPSSHTYLHSWAHCLWNRLNNIFQTFTRL